jgi:hypothetical protein
MESGSEQPTALLESCIKLLQELRLIIIQEIKDIPGITFANSLGKPLVILTLNISSG